MITVVLVVVGCLLVASFVAAAGGLDRPRRVRRVRRSRVVQRPAERVVERRVVD